MTDSLQIALYQHRQSLIQELTREFKAFRLPPSMLLSNSTLNSVLRAEREWANKYKSIREAFEEAANQLLIAPQDELPKVRQEQADEVYSSPMYKSMLTQHKTSISRDIINGVPVEIFEPEKGVRPNNQAHILLNLHGGGFIMGSRTMSHLESIPMTCLSGVKVVSVTYRTAPEASFPSATDDICVVYKTLISQYEPEKIGFFGSSTGGALVAQSLARLIKDGLPLPGAAIMAGGAAHGWQDGDSGYLAGALNDYPHFPDFSDNYLYFKDCDPRDPLVCPGYHPEILKRFPPSLLASSTRDSALSVVVKTHSELARLGLINDLYIWEGLHHCFYLDRRIPESDEFYDACIRFFNKHLSIQ